MSGTSTVHEHPVSGPVRGWADLVEAYWPVVEQNAKRSMSHPKVSVCIVANNAERDLQAAIDSVLAQPFDDLEIVVVHNELPYVTRDPFGELKNDRVRIIRSGATASLGESFNLAVRHSRGQFVKLLCTDGTLRSDCIAAQAEVLDGNHGVALVAGRTDYLDHTGKVVRRQRSFARIVGIRSAQHVVKTIVRSGGNPIGPTPGAMFRRADFERCGGYPADLPDTSDLALWIRLLGFGEFYGMPETLASLRDVGSSMTTSAAVLLRLAERIEFTRRLVDDPMWNVPATDRMVGHLTCCINQVRIDILRRRHGSKWSRATALCRAPMAMAVRGRSGLRTLGPLRRFVASRSGTKVDVAAGQCRTL